MTVEALSCSCPLTVAHFQCSACWCLQSNKMVFKKKKQHHSTWLVPLSWVHSSTNIFFKQTFHTGAISFSWNMYVKGTLFPTLLRRLTCFGHYNGVPEEYCWNEASVFLDSIADFRKGHIWSELKLSGLSNNWLISLLIIEGAFWCTAAPWIT